MKYTISRFREYSDLIGVFFMDGIVVVVAIVVVSLKSLIDHY